MCAVGFPLGVGASGHVLHQHVPDAAHGETVDRGRAERVAQTREVLMGGVTVYGRRD